MSDLSKEIANTVIRIKTEMRKAQFASRSEAGRYAANQRWKGQGKKGKTPLDDLSIRGMTPAKMAASELRAHIDEQEGLLEAMRDNGASKAELKQQKGLITLARRDLRRMEEEQAKAEAPKSTHRASYLEYRFTNKQGRDKAFSEAMIMKAGKGLNEKYGAPLATKDDVAFAAQVKDELESAIAPLEQEVRDVLGKLDANEGDRATNLKSLQRVKTKFAALARKSEKDAKASGNYANALEENTVRTMVSRTRTMIFEMASRDVGFVLDQEKAIDKGLQSRMSKGKSFASRSEAGRYAANMRWKGQGQATSASGQLAGTPQSANVTLVGQVKSPAINASSDAVSEGSYEQDEMQIERYLDELKQVGTDILGKKSFGIQFGQEIDSIKDRLREGRYESPNRFSPKGSLDRAKVLQEKISEAASKIDFTPRDRMRAEAILQQYDEQIQSLDRAGTRLTERQSRDQISYIEKVNGGRKVLEAGSRERALGIIAELDKSSVKYMQRARQYEFKATGAEAPRFKNLARTANAQMHQYADQQAGAEMVFEALYDEQLEKAQFASRSEAARYAANQRWKGQGKKTAEAKERLSESGKYRIDPQFGQIIDQGYLDLGNGRKVAVKPMPGKEGHYTIDMPSHETSFRVAETNIKNSDGTPQTGASLSIKPKWSPNESVIRALPRVQTPEEMMRQINDEVQGYEPPIEHPGKPLYRVAIHSTASTDVVIEKMTRNGWEQQAIQSVADEDGQEYEEGLEGRVVAKFQANLKAKAKENQWNYDPVVAWS